MERNKLLADFDDSVDGHLQVVDRHHLQNRPATIGDFNRADLFYSNRSAIQLPPFARENFAIHPAYYTLVSRGKFRGHSDESPLDHLEVFEDLVSSIKAAGVPADYLLCKLFPHSLAGRGTSWLRQLELGSLTNWTDTKNAFMIHFLDDSVTKLLREKISSFSQAPTKGFKAAWIIFKSYQRECPQHGFQESQLINIFYRGIAMSYQAQLDAASYCNFMIRTTSEALLLITNALTSLSTQEVDTKRRISAEKATASKETPISAISAPIHHHHPPPPSSETRMESMLAQLLAGLTKLEIKYDSIFSKIDNLRSHTSELSPPSVSINAVTLPSGKQLNPILHRER